MTGTESAKDEDEDEEEDGGKRRRLQGSRRLAQPHINKSDAIGKFNCQQKDMKSMVSYRLQTYYTSWGSDGSVNVYGPEHFVYVN